MRHEVHGAFEMEPNDLGLAIAFTDSDGARWLRNEGGALKEVSAGFYFDEAEERA